MNKPLHYGESSECWLPSQLDKIAPAVACLTAYLRQRGVGEEVWRGIELAVTEALNNAVLHGAVGREEEGVWLRWTLSEDLLVITIHDPSSFMPDSASADLPDDPLSESGRGHFLMASLMDEVAHVLVDGHHAIELKKKIDSTAWSPMLMAETEAALNSITAELSSCYENLSAVFGFSEILATAPKFSDFSKTVLERLNVLVKAQQSYIRFENEEHTGLREVVSVGDAIIHLPTTVDKQTECLEVEAFVARVGRGIESGAALSPKDPLRQVRGALMVCPVFFRTDVLGCLTVIRPPHAEGFLAPDRAMIRVVADFLGIAYMAGVAQEHTKKEEMARRELEIASSIQQSLLPSTFPQHSPYRTYGLCRSAREVGGDYFNVIPIGDHGMLLVIADVMGKGMPAALLATVLRTAVQARQDMAATPGKLLTEVNRQLASDLDNLDMFITAKLAFLSFEDNSIHYADAGHCPILVRRPGQSELLQLQADGYPIGVSNRCEYPAECFKTEPGDVFIFVTDGIYENLEEHGLASSFDYLKQRLMNLKHGNLRDFCNQVILLSEENVGSKPLLDDRTILVLERER